MDIYKLTPESKMVKKITKENFEHDSGLKAPYYSLDRKSQAAVCPACNNPILIIGLYDRERPFGKHHNQTIQGLATFNPNNYFECPYANPNWKDTEREKKPKMDKTATDVRDIVISQLDKIIRLLVSETGIKFSIKLITKMVNTYTTNEGYLYRRAHTANVPWTFGYLAWRQAIFGIGIVETSPLYQAILKEKRIKLDSGRIESADNKFLAIEYYFTNHRTRTKNSITNECIDFKVMIQEYGRDKELYSTTIIIYPEKFTKLLSSDVPRSSRDEEIINLAHKFVDEG